MQVLCKLLLYNKYITGAYDLLYSAVHPMKYLESDVMWYIKGNSLKTKLLLLQVLIRNNTVARS